MTIKLKPRWKYLRGEADTGSHGKVTGNNGAKRRLKHKETPNVRGGRARAFS